MSNRMESIVASIKELTVVELAELVKTLENELGVTAAAVAAPGAAAPAGEAAEEKTSFKLELVGFEDGKKMPVIKALRSAKSSLGLIEAKKAVEDAGDSSPFEVVNGVKKDEVEALKKTMEEAGAKVKVS